MNFIPTLQQRERPHVTPTKSKVYTESPRLEYDPPPPFFYALVRAAIAFPPHQQTATKKRVIQHVCLCLSVCLSPSLPLRRETPSSLTVAHLVIGATPIGTDLDSLVCG